MGIIVWHLQGFSASFESLFREHFLHNMYQACITNCDQTLVVFKEFDRRYYLLGNKNKNQAATFVLSEFGCQAKGFFFRSSPVLFWVNDPFPHLGLLLLFIF